MKFKEILEYSFIHLGEFKLSLHQIIAAVLIITVARILMSVIKKLLNRYFVRKEVDPGRRFAFIQFIKYIFYTAALLMALEAVGISLSLLWGGAAALMVGIGLGLQQTFTDLISGIILLIEGSIEVDDVVEVDGIVGTVTSIGIRTCKIETRDRIAILIPNSKLVGDKAINWSHIPSPTRFHVKAGVAYSSDIKLVTQLLLQAAKEHKDVLETPPSAVMFNGFGDSSLDFTLLFFTLQYARVEFIKSEIRYRIVELFRENNIEIPFPQQDLWVRNPEDLVKESQQNNFGS